MYFGNLSETATNLDSQGNTLLKRLSERYLSERNQFSSVSVTNDYVNNMSAQVQLNILSGVPSYLAVLVDDTNYAADANWQAYAGTNLAVNLGLNGGWHNVWIGLKGLPPIGTKRWRSLSIGCRHTPVMVITNPVSNTVSVPVIQIYGYCQDSLASLCYDLSQRHWIDHQPACRGHWQELRHQ